MERYFLNDYFIKDKHPVTINVIGCGGTGSFVLANLARLDYTLKALGKKGIFVIAMDPDNVSEFNVGRQMFYEQDVKSNKAIALISRINRTYGLAWEGLPIRYEPSNTVSANIVISCVDNIRCRKNIHELFFVKENTRMVSEEYRRHYWLDIGNEADFGQIVLHGNDHSSSGFFSLFPDLYSNPVDNDSPSCSMQEALSKQNLFINQIMATYATNMLYEFLTLFYLEYRYIFVNLSSMKIQTK